MMTVKQVAELAGLSVRTLQFYDQIGLLKPTKVTEVGYRLYDEQALETLQQVLFFKELDFTLKEIKAIMDSPTFDRMAAYKKQRELIQMKRDRLTSLLDLLDQLLKGETTMELNRFDMTAYFEALSAFKTEHTDEIVARMGSLDAFDEMLAQLHANEQETARLALEQYGSMEAFTEAMKKNFQDFLSNGPAVQPSEVAKVVDRTEAITRTLTADLSRDVSAPEVQAAVGELMTLCETSNAGIEVGENYWQTMADLYRTNPAFIQGTDKKYGTGAADFIERAILAHLSQQ